MSLQTQTDRKALLSSLIDELAEESADLDARVAPLAPQVWLTATPAEGWDIRDTVNHLAATDDDAVLAATDADGFASLVSQLLQEGAGYVDRLVDERRSLSPEQALADWRTGRERLAAVLSTLDPAVRVPWFGPPMSPASFVTARLMETWAHGQDVADALGQERTPTHRLRSVAEIGVRARAFSYLAHSLRLPETPVRVELSAPTQELWSWGPQGAPDVVRAPALDFCLLVTQRRHRDDLSVLTTGPHAAQWMDIAQAFAGPPGGGRPPRR